MLQNLLSKNWQKNQFEQGANIGNSNASQIPSQMINPDNMEMMNQSPQFEIHPINPNRTPSAPEIAVLKPDMRRSSNNNIDIDDEMNIDFQDDRGNGG